jgi:hypothetical protein
MKLNDIGDSVQISGTSLIGYVRTNYSRLVEVFGEPTYSGDSEDKTQAEWSIEFINEDYETFVASIYDWKQYELGIPCGDYDWHIGGNDPIVIDEITKLVNA